MTGKMAARRNTDENPEGFAGAFRTLAACSDEQLVFAKGSEITRSRSSAFMNWVLFVVLVSCSCESGLVKGFVCFCRSFDGFVQDVRAE